LPKRRTRRRERDRKKQIRTSCCSVSRQECTVPEARQLLKSTISRTSSPASAVNRHTAASLTRDDKQPEPLSRRPEGELAARNLRRVCTRVASSALGADSGSYRLRRRGEPVFRFVKTGPPRAADSQPERALVAQPGRVTGLSREPQRRPYLFGLIRSYLGTSAILPPERRGCLVGMKPRGGGRPAQGCPVQAGELWPETCVPAAESIARRGKHKGVNVLNPRGRSFVTGARRGCGRGLGAGARGDQQGRRRYARSGVPLRQRRGNPREGAQGEESRRAGLEGNHGGSPRATARRNPGEATASLWEPSAGSGPARLCNPPWRSLTGHAAGGRCDSARQPLTRAVVLPNDGTPSAAPETHPFACRIRSRERSSAQAPRK